jgi:hypothetical protein
MLIRPLDLINRLNTYDLSDIVRFYCPIDKKYYYIWGLNYVRVQPYHIINFTVINYNKMNYSPLTYRYLLNAIHDNATDLSASHSIYIMEHETHRMFNIIQ